MNLYLISQEVNTDWDTFSSAVVIAESEEEARKIHPCGITLEQRVKEAVNKDLVKKWFYDNWTTPDNVTAIFLGVYTGEQLKLTEVFDNKIICANFNAG